MSKFLILMILVMFIAICIKLINDNEWYLVASLLVGLITSRDSIKSLWDESEAETS
jgi:hypothetical protein